MIGDYQIIRDLGEGAFSIVKLCRDRRDGKNYAMKIVDYDSLVETDQAELLEREISIMMSMNHPSLVKLHHVLRSPHHIFLVLDFAAGGELFTKLAEGGPLSEDQARCYFQQLIDALSYMHSKHITHRDLKPENLLLGVKGNLLVADFGLSISSKTTNQVLLTRCGTPNYVAPEVFLSPSGYAGPPCDLWSAGVILFVMLAAALPFDADTLPELARQISTADIEYPTSFPKGAVSLLKKIIVVDPKKRIKISEIKNDRWFQVNYNPIPGNEKPGTTSFQFDPSMIEHIPEPDEGVSAIDLNSGPVSSNLFRSKFKDTSSSKLIDAGQKPSQAPDQAASSDSNILLGQEMQDSANDITAFELIAKVSSVSCSIAASEVCANPKTTFSYDKPTKVTLLNCMEVISEMDPRCSVNMGEKILKAKVPIGGTEVHIRIQISQLTSGSSLVEVGRGKGSQFDFLRVYRIVKQKLEALLQ